MRSAIAILVALSAGAASGQSLSVTAAVSQDRLYVGEIVTLEVVCIATGNGNVEIEVPDVDGLDELRRGTSDSTSISWTNGAQAVRRERTLRIDFEARKAGTITIPPVLVQLGNERQKTAPIPITVMGSGTQDDPAAAKGAAAIPGQVLPPTNEEGELFIRYRTDKAEALVGEQILVDLEIFANGTFSLDETRAPIGPDGFWREILERPDHLEHRTELVNGRHYRVYRLWRIALFGLDAGEKTLPPTQLTFSTNRSIFSAGQRLRRSAPPVSVLIKPLPPPPGGAPPRAVGVFTLESSVDQTTVVAGKGALLTLTLAGAGHISGAKLPDVAAVDGFRVYPARVNEDVQRTRNGVTGWKKAEILLVPTRGGRLEIPAVQATVWNPDKASYETLSTRPIVVSVEGEIAPQPAEVAAPEPSREASAPQMRPMIHPARLDRGPPVFAGTRAQLAALAVPVLLLGIAYLASLRRDRPQAESASAKARRALLDARALLDQASPKSSPGDASEAVLAYASARTGVNLRGLTLAETANVLREATGDAALADRVIAHLRACDYARFAPQGSEAPGRALVGEARALLDALEAST